MAGIREGMSNTWDAGKRAKQAADYRALWTEGDIKRMKDAARAGGITGFNGSYAKCITVSGNNVTIDRACMEAAAKSGDIGDKYRAII